MGKLKNCKSCGQTFTSDEKVCSKCGAYVKIPIFKKWWFWLIIAVALILIVSLANKNNTDKNNNNNSTANSSAQSTNQDSTTLIGKEAVLGDATVIVNKISKTQGKEVIKPKDGYEYIIVAITIKNTGADNLSYNPFDFRMLNSEGKESLHIVTTIDSSTSLYMGTLVPGGEVSGTIVFEQPKGDNGLVLKYSNNIFSDEKILIKL